MAFRQWIKNHSSLSTPQQVFCDYIYILTGKFTTTKVVGSISLWPIHLRVQLDDPCEVTLVGHFQLRIFYETISAI